MQAGFVRAGSVLAVIGIVSGLSLLSAQPPIRPLADRPLLPGFAPLPLTKPATVAKSSAKLTEPTKPTPVPTPADTVAMAAIDIATLSPADAGYQRYFYTADNSKEFYGAFCYVLNSVVSHASTLYRPVRLAEGHLIRIDLRRLWPGRADYDALLPVYEQLAEIDPYYHVVGEIKTKQKTTEFEEKDVTEKTGRQITQLVPLGNGRFSQQLVDEVQTVKKKVPVEKEQDVVEKQSQHAVHLLGERRDDAPILRLAAATRSAIPIMRADWFVYIATNSAEEENGRYYQLRLIEKSKDNKTAEQLWLTNLGIDYQIVQNVRADQRIGRWRSGVTGRPRAIEYFFSPSARPSVGPSGVAITRDYIKGKIDAKNHPIKNLLNYKHDGSEGFGFLRNGMMSFILLDGNGELVTKAPPNLVADRTIPPPHDTELTSMISCIRCHGSHDMWIDAPNDVLALSKGARGLNFFDDESDKADPEATADRLAGLYAGEMDEFIRIARNTHAKATFIVTGGMEIPDVTKKIGEIYNQYRYDPVTPQTACLDLGWRVPAAEAADWFARIVPKLPPNRHGVSPESVTIGTLRAATAKHPLAVNRDDWEQEFADAMLRATTEAIRNPINPTKK